MLEKLTPEQEAKFPYYVKKWAEIGNAVVPVGFYDDPTIIGRIKKCVVAMYAAAGKKLDPDNVIMSSSPIMSPFVAAARVVGKKGTPKKAVKCKLPNMKSVEDFLNTFSNPKEIIEASSQYYVTRYWASLDAPFLAFIDFFKQETELKDGALKPHLETHEYVCEISHLAYDLFVLDDFCVVSMRPIRQTLEKSPDGDFPVAKSGTIEWQDGTVIAYPN